MEIKSSQFSQPGTPLVVGIRMLGGLSVEHSNPPRTINRFRSQRFARLLAYLAFHRGRSFTREELLDLFWTDVPTDDARANLRNALSSLRAQLEPPGVPHGAVLVAHGRERISLNAETTWTDVERFEGFLHRSRITSQTALETSLLLEEVLLQYRGPLLSGMYDDWLLPHRDRFADAYWSVLDQLSALAEQAGDLSSARDYARRAVAAASDPLWETDPEERLRLQERARVLAGREQHSSPQLPQAVQENTGACPLPAPHVGSSRLHRPNTPLCLTRFFGREEEVASLMALLTPVETSGEGTVRMVTITGTGGSGKTRLAIAVAEQSGSLFPGGVVWVSLAEVTEGRHIAGAVAGAIKATRSGDSAAGGTSDADPLDLAVTALGGIRPSLLILDNVEHVAEEAAPLVEQLLARTPRLSCLVTSRQRLLLGIEREFLIPPLSKPPLVEADIIAGDRTFRCTPEESIRYPAVQLFVDRAQAARPDFQLTPRNVAAVGAVCTLLEGLPLGLELAAGWSQTHTPRQILEVLECRRTDVLVARRRDLLPRHHSLRTVFESSFNLLEPGLQSLLLSLSVFHGTWTGDAAQAVCVGEELGPQQVLEGLGRLRDRSLLIAEEHDDGIRLRMLMTVRLLADERLTKEQRVTVTRRHALYYLRRAEEAEPHLRSGPRQAEWMRTLEADLNNIRAVLSRSESTQDDPQELPEDQDLPLRLAGALWWFWVIRGHWSEGLRCLQDLLADSAREDALTLTIARALYTAGTLAWTLNLYEECTAYCEQSLNACRQLNDRWGSSFSLALLGTIAARQGQYREAHNLLEESLASFQEIGDRWGTAFALDHLAHACRDEQAYQQAMEFYAESLSLRKESGDQQGMAMSLSNLADTVQLQGHWERAVVLHETSLDRFRQLGDRAGIAYCVGRLADCALQGNDVGRATTLTRESLRMFHELGDKRRIAECLEKIAELRRTEGQSEAAVRLLGAASALRTERHMPLPASERCRVESSTALLRTTLGSPAFESGWIQGQTMDIEEAVQYAFGQR